MDELERIRDAVKPQEILLVVDAMTGQDAVNVAQTFNDKLDIQGVILTKLDGDTRGGAALSVRAVTGKPIKFSGVGEKLSDIEPFHPDRMASRILGMGDVLTLIDKASEAFDEKDLDKLAQPLPQRGADPGGLPGANAVHEENGRHPGDAQAPPRHERPRRPAGAGGRQRPEKA